MLEEMIAIQLHIMKTRKPCSLMILEPGKPPPAAKRARKERRKGTGMIIPTSSSTENMDQDIWKDFPEDLFESVIARLPIATFFRLRSVCRKWDTVLSCESFSKQCEQVPRSHPWFYTITHENVNTGAMYDPSMKKWHHPTVPALPTKQIVLPVASAGGLVCFVDIGHRSFYVCNPLTKSFRELPARSVNVWSRVAVGMALDGGPGSGYKIVWVSRDGEYEVYASRENRWARTGVMGSSIRLPLSLNFKSQAVTIEGRVYMMRSEPEGIVCYDTESGVWKEYPVPSPSYVSDETIAESGGRIILVGLLTKNAATCVCIWELQKMTLLWKEVDRMPNEWCLEFYGKHVRMSCLGNKDLLMLSIRSRQMNRLVTYHVSRREWVKVPGCVLPRARKRQWIACGTAFHPCLAAQP